ncbi:MAG TPA: DoxX family protein [Anaerolineales bacterium]|jgi:VIT1/CCC1 family predicted Fe2+/Mn2+ transporter|nr:DoxX family protein [Anaerolineales bacterium]HNA87687.1 DoxX family protein [Anaerolineales bacterium]HNB34662.1 DoxX family protein [Anaerolineales bacterium]HNC07661.1 DoxX family protein [Anaerolineales bacterium]HNJ11962.1 DoxX family protein [Anaerolineales bacterium]
MNIALWIVQGLLAAFYLIPGTMKTFMTPKAKETLPWAKERSNGFVRFVGISELLGVLGLILPLVTGILPWLTVLAGVGLSLLQLLAIFTEHLPKREYNVLPVNLALLALSVFVVFGRWELFL